MPVDLFQQNSPSQSQSPTDLLAQAGMTPSVASQATSILSGQNPNAIKSALAAPGINSPQAQGALAALKGAGAVTAGIGGAAALGGLGLGATAANVIGQPLGGAAYGAATNPQSPETGALEGAASAVIPSAIGGAANIAGKLTNFLGGAHLQDMSDIIDSANTGVKAAQTNLDTNASSLFKTLSNAQPQTDLNNQNWSTVLKNGAANKTQSTANYNAVMDNSAAQGYSTIKNPATDSEQIPGANKKMVVPNNSLNTIIDQSAQEPSPILQAPNYEPPTATPSQNINASLLKNVSGATQNMITRFNQTQSVPNAHNLQSMLGSEASRLYSTGATADRDTADALTTARQGLRSDIIDTFNNNGDTDLADAYQNASDFHKANVTPYDNISSISGALQGKPYSGNIVNLLSKGSSNNPNGLNDLATIRNHIMQNPDQADSFVTQALGKGITPTQNATSDFNINSDKLINNANNLPSNIKSMASPELQSQLGDLQAQKNNIDAQTNSIQSLSEQLKAASEQHQNVMKYVKGGAKIAGLGLAVKYGHEIL